MSLIEELQDVEHRDFYDFLGASNDGLVAAWRDNLPDYRKS
jgi:hypothetical protein